MATVRITPAILFLHGVACLSGCANLFTKPAVDPGDVDLAPVARRMGRNLLLARPHRGMFIQVDWLGEAKPSSRALERLKYRIEYYCDKPAGVVIRVDGGIVDPEWAGDRRSWERVLGRVRDPIPGEGEQFDHLHILYVPTMDVGANYGFYTRWRGVPTITVLKDHVRRAGFLWITTSKVETTLLLHEFGHALGVPARGCHDVGTSHCTMPNCAMYKPVDWRAVFTNWWRALFLLDIPSWFCSKCEKEIEAVREGAR